jgi:hypothetical protein
VTAEPPVSAVEAALRSRRRAALPLVLILALVAVAGVAVVALGVALGWRYTRGTTPHHADLVQHFAYGSIGAEPESGLPYWVWQALPRLFPERFAHRDDYTAFGFLYETDADGRRRDLPIGVARRARNGVELAWLNCAVCHAGTWRERAGGPRHVVLGMPSNNLHFDGFIRFLLDAAADERLAPDRLIPAMQAAGADLDVFDRLLYRLYVIPRVREGLIQRRARLLPLLDLQPAWGPGRVDTFNPYKVSFGPWRAATLAPAERVGTVDFPSIFHQRPREGMQLHWDGNNPSLAERNLSAALGAGVTADSADHPRIERASGWLLDLAPPPSPHRPDPDAVARGRALYLTACAGCHGHQGPRGYVFEGGRLGTVEPVATLGTDRARLDSYTPEFRTWQLANLFAGTPHAFRHFRKTDGYANLPLDGLWLRGPYLHNGSVPTLADLLEPPERRPVAFLRGSDVVDGARGGFVAPPCDPATPTADGFCFDTRRPGNGNGGHRYGTDLPAAAKADLLAYLLTF